MRCANPANPQSQIVKRGKKERHFGGSFMKPDQQWLLLNLFCFKYVLIHSEISYDTFRSCFNPQWFQSQATFEATGQRHIF